MKKSTLTNYYRVFASLYGVISSNDAFDIIKGFHKDFKKSDFINDLKDRWNKYTKEYSVFKCRGTRNTYLITVPYIDDEYIDYILESAKNKPFFIPEGGEEEYFKYKDPSYRDKEFINALEDLKKDEDKIFIDPSEEQLKELYFDIYFTMDIRLFINNFERCVDEGDYPKLKNKESFEILLNHLNILNNSKRLHENRGHTSTELLIASGILDDPFIVIKEMIEAGIKKGFFKDTSVDDFILKLDLEEDVKDRLIDYFRPKRVVEM